MRKLRHSASRASRSQTQVSISRNSAARRQRKQCVQCRRTQCHAGNGIAHRFKVPQTAQSEPQPMQTRQGEQEQEGNAQQRVRIARRECGNAGQAPARQGVVQDSAQEARSGKRQPDQCHQSGGTVAVRYLVRHGGAGIFPAPVCSRDGIPCADALPPQPVAQGGIGTGRAVRRAAQFVLVAEIHVQLGIAPCPTVRRAGGILRLARRFGLPDGVPPATHIRARFRPAHTGGDLRDFRIIRQAPVPRPVPRGIQSDLERILRGAGRLGRGRRRGGCHRLFRCG